MGKKIVCKLCTAIFYDLERYIVHTRVHKGQSSYECAISECGLRCKSIESYKKHLRQQHIQLQSRRTFRCSILQCDSIENSVKKMTKHMKKHLKSGQPVFCPFGCQNKKPFQTENSLRIHNMYFHRNENVRTNFGGSASAVSTPESLAASSPDVVEVGELSEINTRAESKSVLEKLDDTSDTIFNIFGNLFLKLLSQNHVTETAIQEVVTALGEAADVQNSYISNCCAALSVPDEDNSSELKGGSLKDFGQKLCNANIFDAMFGSTGKFRSSHMRKKYYRENYSFVPSVEVSLQKDNEHKDASYYYVSILETLTSMLNDPKVYNAVFRERLKVPGYLTDYDDGAKFKNSDFFTNKTLNIFLYQDACEMVVNAIGNATSRYKLLCMYMTLGNLDPHLRCKTENVHLVLLCKNKDFSFFGGNCVFRRLVEDIKILEDEGIVVNGGGSPETIRGSIFTTMNDNLGAHQIAGLVENFSTSPYFCRTCYIDHQTFQNDCLHSSKLRTPDTHLCDLREIENNPSSIPFRGVKAACIFDELKYFKMFDYGAAPCVAHDLFEGWINADLFLILKRFSKEQRVSSHFIQGRINEVCYKLKLDTKIVIDFTRKSKNIKAKACDIWHIVQIIPFVLLNKVVNYEGPLISMLILIKNITDIITSTVVSKTQVLLLRSYIAEYLELRKSNFETPLRPKHHFTTHYPRLILCLGPLMSYCTLFCERKHCFFKRAVRSTLNFKNVVKFCAERHQFYQALLGQQNSRFDRHFVVAKYVESYVDLPDAVQVELQMHGLLNQSALYAEEASYCGYCYKANDYLFMEHCDLGERFFIVNIQLLVFDKTTEQITVFGRKCSVLHAAEKGLMEIIEEPNIVVARNVIEFVDRAPLKAFNENGRKYLFIQHAIPLM